MSSSDAPSLTNVTINTVHNVYDYSASTLWLAYGISIGVTLIGIVAGIIAIIRSNGSYSSDISTIIRATRHADLSLEIHPTDVGGQDPLPKYLARANITFQRDRDAIYSKQDGEDMDLTSHGQPEDTDSRSEGVSLVSVKGRAKAVDHELQSM